MNLIVNLSETTPIGRLTFGVTIIAYFILVIDIIKNKDKTTESQSFFTWFLWLILDYVLFIATDKVHGSDLPLIYGSVIGSFSISVSLLFMKKIKWGENEWINLILVIITLFFWFITRSAKVGIVFAVASEIIAGIQQMKASWRNPGTKLTLVSYVFFIASYVLALLDAPNWNIENTLFPLAFLIYCIGDTTPLIKKYF